jgi:hypothetical protein
MSMFPPELDGRRIDVATSGSPILTDDQREASMKRAAHKHLFLVTVSIVGVGLLLTNADRNPWEYFGAAWIAALIGLRWGTVFSTVKDVYWFYACPLSLFMLVMVELKNGWLL